MSSATAQRINEFGEPVRRLLRACDEAVAVSEDDLDLLQLVTLKDMIRLDSALSSSSAVDAHADPVTIWTDLRAALSSRKAKGDTKRRELLRRQAELESMLTSSDVAVQRDEAVEEELIRVSVQLSSSSVKKVANSRLEWELHERSSLEQDPLIRRALDERDARCADLAERVQALENENEALRRRMSCVNSAGSHAVSDLRILMSALSDELLRHDRYPAGKCADVRVLGKLQFADLAKWCVEHPTSTSQQVAAGWTAIGRSLLDGTTRAVIGNKTVTQRDCFLEAVTRDPSIATAWTKLAETMHATDKVNVVGVELTQRQCYVEALRRDPNNSLTWAALAALLSSNPAERVSVYGVPRNQQQCFLESIRCDASNADAWVNMGIAIGPKDRVLVNNHSRTQRQCFLEALRASPNNSTAWYNLAITLGPSETATVNGVARTQRKCFIEALRADATNSTAWNNLASLMDVNEQVAVHNATLNQRQCIIQALRCDAKNGDAWLNLASVLEPGESVSISGTLHSQKQCLVEALCCDPKNSDAWTELGCVMDPDETLQIGSRASPVTQRRCFELAVAIDAANPAAWFNLSELLASEKDFVVLEGKRYSKSQCLRMSQMANQKTTSDQ